MKVSLREEVAPQMGVERNELDQNIWNSPPAIKGEGRYLILGRTIAPADFTALKRASLVWYWNEEFLEEADMFYASPGWRTNSSGIKMLQNKGYEVEIDTLEMQRERNERAKKERKEREEKEKREREENETAYKTAIADYEMWLGNPEWTRDSDGRIGKGDYINLKRIQSANATIYNDEYYLYSLTSAGYIAVHRHYNADWWDNLFSVNPAPNHVVAEAEKLRAEAAAQREKQLLEIAERKKQAIYYHMRCTRCGREVYFSAEVAKGQDVRCRKCHTGKVATVKTTAVMEKIGEVQRQHIPEEAEIR